MRRAALDELAGLPVPDRAIFALCDRIVALHVRPEGNLMRLLQARLRLPGFPVASVFLALGADLVPRDQAGELLDAGRRRLVCDERGGEPDHDSPARGLRPSRQIARRPRSFPVPGGRLAVLDALHAAADGPLAGRERGQVPGRPDPGPRGRRSFRLGRPVADRASGRLLASGEFVRGETPVVS